MPYCAGCNKDFSKQGYGTHFSHTSHLPCLRILRAAEMDLSDSDSDTRGREIDEEEFGQDLHSDFPTGAPHFSGDFFGNDYSESDFGYNSDGEEFDVSDSDSESGTSDPAANERVAVANARDEEPWEPERDPVPQVDQEMEDTQNSPEKCTPPSRETRIIAEDHFHQQPFIDKFPSPRAGEIISPDRVLSGEEKYRSRLGDPTNPYAPFTSKMDWEVARWAKLRGSGSTAFTDLLKIDGVRDALGLSYGTSAQLNKVIDKDLPGRPQFTRSEVVVGGESFDLYSRDILACVRALFGDKDFAPYLFVLPERHYADADKTIRLYHNMHTAKWWWSTQKAVEKDNPGATIIPILLSSDKTQLTVFGNRSAYPVYMTIGNIPKEIRRKPSRRAYVLLAYLPTSRLNHIKNDASRRRTLANLFHACLSHITAPLREAGIKGIPVSSGDGKIRRCHPIVACYIGDYPEQVLVTCVKTGDTETLGHLGNARERFYENKEIFVDLGVRSDFNLPKLHSWNHYHSNITLYGTSDNYNTEYTERLHIDLAKDAYRATNSKDEFPQMTVWLERKEKILRHDQYIQWRLKGCPKPPVVMNLHPGVVYERKLVMPKHPTRKSVKFSVIQRDYGAKFFPEALSRYVAQLSEPNLTRTQLEHAANNVDLFFNSLPVFQRIKFSTSDPYGVDGPEDKIVDAIHVQPGRTLVNGDSVPARFDTALVNTGDGGRTGTKRYRIAQIRVVFTIPAHKARSIFPLGIDPPKHLAYVEWFSPFTKEPERNHLMYKVSRTEKDGERMASIIPVENIHRSIHLLPKFGSLAPPEWKSSNVLDTCSTFFANPWTDRHIYATMF
ncbi:hypothetical protein B0H11DRAFT_2309570 [Mycena galericulata]|nr:hypothetical protein B0H11DRAFT_2309570 [Mycena galericulata]